MIIGAARLAFGHTRKQLMHANIPRSAFIYIIIYISAMRLYAYITGNSPTRAPHISFGRAQLTSHRTLFLNE